MKLSFILSSLLMVSSAFGNVCFNADTTQQTLPTIEGVKVASEICITGASSDLLPFGLATLNASLVVDGVASDIAVKIDRGTAVAGGYKIVSKILYQNSSDNEVCGAKKEYLVRAELIVDTVGELVAVTKVSGHATDSVDSCHDMNSTVINYN